MKKFILIIYALLLLGCHASTNSNRPVPVFALLDAESEGIYDGDGSWGVSQFGHPMALRDSYWRADVYSWLYFKNQGPHYYIQRAFEVADYLQYAQQQSGTGLFSFPANTDNPEFSNYIALIEHECTDCIENGWVVKLPTDYVAELYYDHGYALATLAKLFLLSKDDQLLPAIIAAGEWCLDKPLTGNINYLSALSKGLSLAFEATSDERFLNRAVELHEKGILPFQLESGAWSDPHNQQLEYHAFIVSGLLALTRVLPKQHSLQTQLNASSEIAIAHLAERSMTESGEFGATWPGTAAIAWHELQQLRELTDKENAALSHGIALMKSYVLSIQNATGFTYRKALYSYFSVGYFQ